MTALLNLVVPIIILVFMVVGYIDWKKNKSKARILLGCLIPMICVLYVYQLIQPSYLPKGGVAKMKRMPIQIVEHETEDRLRRPVSTDSDRKDNFNSIMDYKSEVDKLIYED